MLLLFIALTILFFMGILSAVEEITEYTPESNEQED